MSNHVWVQGLAFGSVGAKRVPPARRAPSSAAEALNPRVFLKGIGMLRTPSLSRLRLGRASGTEIFDFVVPMHA